MKNINSFGVSKMSTGIMLETPLLSCCSCPPEEGININFSMVSGILKRLFTAAAKSTFNQSPILLIFNSHTPMQPAKTRILNSSPTRISQKGRNLAYHDNSPNKYNINMQKGKNIIELTNLSLCSPRI